MEHRRIPDWGAETNDQGDGPSERTTKSDTKRSKGKKDEPVVIPRLPIASIKDAPNKPPEESERVSHALMGFIVNQEASEKVTTKAKKRRKKEAAAQDEYVAPLEIDHEDEEQHDQDEVATTAIDQAETRDWESVTDEKEPTSDLEGGPLVHELYKRKGGEYEEVPLDTLYAGEVLLHPQESIAKADIPEIVPVINAESEEIEPIIPIVPVEDIPRVDRLVAEQQEQAAEMPHTVDELAESESESAPDQMVPLGVPESDDGAAVFTELTEPTDPILPPAAVATQRLEPAEAYRRYVESEPNDQTISSVPSGEAMVTKREAEDAAYYAARGAQGSALATGLFVGAAFEHFRHKRRERRAEKRYKEQGRQMRKDSKSQKLYNNEQERRYTETERKLTTVQNTLTASEHKLANQQRYEKPPVPVVIPSPRDPDMSERLNVPTGHHLEKSAWLTTEVENRTGKAVETPAFIYGREYHRERAHENTPIEQRNAAAGEVALVAAASDSLASQPTGNDPSSQSLGNIPSATQQGPPVSRADARNRKDQKSASPSLMSPTGPIWPLLLALAVIFICLLFLL
jgi:hypothetical protein